jgi:hypothetical protein
MILPYGTVAGGRYRRLKFLRAALQPASLTLLHRMHTVFILRLLRSRRYLYILAYQLSARFLRRAFDVIDIFESKLPGARALRPLDVQKLFHKSTGMVRNP